MGTGKLLGKPNKLQGNDLRWTSILATPSRFMLRKPGISYGSYDPVGSKASFILRKRESKNVHLLVFKEFMNSSGIQFLEQNNHHFFALRERKRKRMVKQLSETQGVTTA